MIYPAARLLDQFRLIDSGKYDLFGGQVQEYELNGNEVKVLVYVECHAQTKNKEFSCR